MHHHCSVQAAESSRQPHRLIHGTKVPHGGLAAVQGDTRKPTTGSLLDAENARESSVADPDPVNSYPANPPLQARQPHWLPSE